MGYHSLTMLLDTLVLFMTLVHVAVVAMISTHARDSLRTCMVISSQAMKRKDADACSNMSFDIALKAWSFQYTIPLG